MLRSRTTWMRKPFRGAKGTQKPLCITPPTRDGTGGPGGHSDHSSARLSKLSSWHSPLSCICVRLEVALLVLGEVPFPGRGCALVFINVRDCMLPDRGFDKHGGGGLTLETVCSGALEGSAPKSFLASSRWGVERILD